MDRIAVGSPPPITDFCFNERDDGTKVEPSTAFDAASIEETREMRELPGTRRDR